MTHNLKDILSSIVELKAMGGDSEIQIQSALLSVRKRSACMFYIWLIAAATQFLILIVVSTLTLLGFGDTKPELIAIAFGGTSTGTLLVMARQARERQRTDFILAALETVAESSPESFIKLVLILIEKWYPSSS